MLPFAEDGYNPAKQTIVGVGRENAWLAGPRSSWARI